MKINRNSLKRHYSSLTDEEISSLHKKRSELTDTAFSLIEEEIAGRNLSITHSDDIANDSDNPFAELKNKLGNINSSGEFIGVMIGSLIVLPVYIGVGTALLSIFVFIPVLNIYFVCQGTISYFWEKTDGVIITSSVSKSSDGLHHNHLWFRLSYQYFVDGRTYKGERVSYAYGTFGNLWRTSGRKNRLRAFYMKGRAVKVYYDPDRPAVSVLEPGISLWGIIEMLFFISVSGMIIFLIIKHKKKNNISSVSHGDKAAVKNARQTVSKRSSRFQRFRNRKKDGFRKTGKLKTS